ncbi:predicted protein [Brucella abortus bv. 3 str. Tulya]|nr:predicted protein [Brucella abortus bv. 3 str. Tulya]
MKQPAARAGSVPPAQPEAYAPPDEKSPAHAPGFSL